MGSTYINIWEVDESSYLRSRISAFADGDGYMMLKPEAAAGAFLIQVHRNGLVATQA